MRRKNAGKTVKILTTSKTSHGSAGNSNLVAPKCRRTLKSPAGRGLGKAGAKRLGRLLKRAIQSQVETVSLDLSVPKTPFGLLKHLIRNPGVNGPRVSTPKRASPQISQLIHKLVSECRHRGGMTMAELKQTLATEGYDITRNDQHVTKATKKLLNDDKLVLTRDKRIRVNKPSEKNLQSKTPIKKDPPKLPSTKAESHPKSTTVRSKTSKTQTQAKRALRPSKPESEGSKSGVKRKGKTQTRTQRRRTAKGRPKLKATKKRKAMTAKKRKSRRTVKAPKRQNKRKTQRNKTAKRKHNSKNKKKN